jgi:hypothetical protein
MSQVTDAPRFPVIVSSTPLTLPPCGVSTTSREDFVPGCDALGRFAKERFRTGGLGVGVGVGVPVALVVEVGVCE